MKPSKKIIDSKLRDLRRQEFAFIMQHVPRLHRLLMEAFPRSRDWFGYMIAQEENHPERLTLIRNKKVVARNF